MRIEELDYPLPEAAIAQEPAAERDRARLLILDRASGRMAEAAFADLPDRLAAGSLLVLNDTRVRPARLRFTKASGGRLEILLLAELAPDRARVLIRGRVHPGLVLPLDEASRLEILQRLEAGAWEVRFHGRSAAETLARHGEVPLPPYIRRPARASDRADYQTVYARREGAVAAPTAGLHFTQALLERLRHKGVLVHEVTLHVGMGTFLPVKVERIDQHRMHSEFCSLPPATAEAVNLALREGRRVIPVGSTSMRTLESFFREGELQSGSHWTDIFIYPGVEIKVASALLTNFHLPRSSLLMMISAFAGLDLVKQAYQAAVAERYRFFSYGDAMFIS